MRTKKTTTEEQTVGAAPETEKKTKAKRGRPSKKAKAAEGSKPKEEIKSTENVKPAETKAENDTKPAKTAKTKKPAKEENSTKTAKATKTAKTTKTPKTATKTTKATKAAKTTKATKKAKAEVAVKPQNEEEITEVATTSATPAEPTTEAPAEATKETAKPKAKAKAQEPKPVVVPELPNVRIDNFIDLTQAPKSAIVLNDQQIQLLTLEEAEKRYVFLRDAVCRVLDYDVVISDTNIWVELLVGHTSSHSDPRVNARLMFERQLEFLSRIMKHRGGRFVIMGETYEEIDRFAALQDPPNHKEADFTDNIVCLNAAARLAKRLIFAQQRENRIRIEGISAESHHASFADPAIVRRVVELFAEGKKVLLLTNDSSVAIRSMGLCDDLQRINNISDETWEQDYAPLRPMVFTFDDLKLLDAYTRQLYYIQMAAGKSWTDDIERLQPRKTVDALVLDTEAFRPGDKHRGDNLFIGAEPENVTKQGKQKQKQKQGKKQKQQAQQPQQPQEQEAEQEPEPLPDTNDIDNLINDDSDDDTFIVVGISEKER
ncbi:MAG: hypothetical protein J5905_01250 [Prevotella sp.]|nr:hypothetical protein [Prevotella sp.]